MELLGPSLEELFQKCKKHFSIKTVLLLSRQMIQALQQLHLCGYIHRDIKPENFVIGHNGHTVYLLDFGLCKSFRDPNSGLHIAFRDCKGFIGTARYASINAHLGLELSRRDDLEALGYVFIYFLKGRLPWQNLKPCGGKQKYNLILRKKLEVGVEELCKNLPTEFGMYLGYCRKMKYNERPNYWYVNRMFENLYYNEGYVYDSIYDWTQTSIPVKYLLI